MANTIQKTSYLGDQKIVYLEKQRQGNYSYIHGEWIWVKAE